jgi:hypothetical protein
VHGLPEIAPPALRAARQQVQDGHARHHPALGRIDGFISERDAAWEAARTLDRSLQARVFSELAGIVDRAERLRLSRYLYWHVRLVHSASLAAALYLPPGTHDLDGIDWQSFLRRGNGRGGPVRRSSTSMGQCGTAVSDPQSRSHGNFRD